MSADHYRVIDLTSGETDATECALSDDNAIYHLIEVVKPILRGIKPGAGIALFRPEQGDASVVGIAKADSAQALQLTKAATDVIAERARQISAEGFSLENDDSYKDGQLANAAACYCNAKTALSLRLKAPDIWPWHWQWWKPSSDRRRNLVKAASLILAEIERLDRASENGGAA